MALAISNTVQDTINAAIRKNGAKGVNKFLIPTSVKSVTGSIGGTPQAPLVVPPPTPPATSAPATPVKGLLDFQTPNFSSLLSSVASAAVPSSQQQALTKALQDRAALNTAVGDDAKTIADKYASEIARIGKLGAGGVAGYLSTGTNPVGAGNAAIASQSASSRMNALSDAETAELLGNAQRLTGQQQATNALSEAVGGANTQQQLQQAGLSIAAGLAQPSVTAYGQTVFNPITGQFTGSGGNLDPQVQAQNLAEQVMSGRMTYDQALASLGYAGQAGTNFLNTAITSRGGNPLQLQTQGAVTQSNIQQAGTAQTDIARQGLADATQTYVTMNASAQYAGQQANAVAQILEQSGLNNSASADYNKVINNIRGRFSDPQFAALNTALQEARAAYTQLLSSTGGTPTGREEIALSTLDTNSTPEKITASIQQLNDAVARRLQAQYGAVQQYQSNLGGGSGNSLGNGGEITWDSLI